MCIDCNALGKSQWLIGPAIEPGAVEPSNPERIEIEMRVLACQDDVRRQSDRTECVRDGSKLDGFRPGTNDKRNTTSAQLSP